MRQDGPFIEAGENDNLIVQRIEADPNAVGIFGYSFLYENEDKLQGVKISGIQPSFETIADKSYGLSRPLFFYIKNAHRNVIPGLNDFVVEYTSDAAGRVTSVTDPTGTTTFTYDVVGNLTSTTLPNGVVETRTYDARDRVRTIEKRQSGHTCARDANTKEVRSDSL